MDIHLWIASASHHNGWCDQLQFRDKSIGKPLAFPYNKDKGILNSLALNIANTMTLQKQKTMRFLPALCGFLLLISPMTTLAAEHLPSFIEDALNGLPTSTRAQIEKSINRSINSIPSVEEVRNNALADLLEVTVVPERPAPNERVALSVVSYLTDLNRGEIFWYINDELRERGVGKTSFSFTVKEAGSISRVDIVINTAEGARIAKKLTFRPADMDFMWEALTYTPPFYKGKALLSAESPVKIVVMPHFVSGNGKTIPSRSLV